MACECVEDLAADSVVYAEVRFAPELHIDRGLSLDEVVDAVLAGFADGEKAAPPRAVRSGALLVTAMRHAALSREIAELAIRFRDKGVVGFDIAGAEAGYPRRATSTRSSTCENITPASPFTLARRSGCHPSMRRSHYAAPTGSVTACASSTTSTDGADGGGVRLGRLASILRDKRIPLELCPSSNVQTGAVASIAEHPFDLLARLRFRVTVNTDNRLMSDTSMSKEMLRLVEAFGYGWSDLARFTINAMKSAFIPFDERLAIIDEVIKPRFAVLIG